MDLGPPPLFSLINLKRKAHFRNSKQVMHIKNCYHLLIWRGKLLFGFNDGKPFPYLINMSDSRDVLGNTGQIGSFNDADRNYHPDLPKGTYFCDLRNLLPVLNSKYANLCATAKGMYEWHKRVNFCQSCGGK